MAQRLTRAEVPAEQRWNLEDLFSTRDAWEAELKEIEAALAGGEQFTGRLGEGAAHCLASLTAFEDLFARVIRATTYAGLRNAEDGANPENQAAVGTAMALQAKAGALHAQLEATLLGLPEGTLERYLAEEPGLADCRRYLGRLIAEKPHKLSMEAEVALASLAEVHHAPQMIYERIKASDITFEPITDASGTTHPVSFSTYEETLERAPDIDLRRKAWASFNKGLNAYRNTMAATFATEVKKHVVLARLRKYDSATHMLLHPEEVSVETYHNVLDTIQTELAPIMRRYARLRKRVLGMETMLYPDIEAPLDPTYAPQTTYAEASRLILDSLEVMGPEYAKIIRTSFAEGWIDWSDNVGKSTGAFCSSPYGAHSYVLISWANSLRGAFVLAHELGHAAHFTLANRCQRLINTWPSMFFVEAPSTINELLLAQHLMRQNPEPRLRRWINMGLLQTYHHNFVRHLLEGELQRRMYDLAEKGTPITANTLCEAKGAILREFWGDTVEIDEGAKLTWMRQPHYYMGLYSYTYSAGLTVATAAAEAIREEGQPAVERWLQALKAGGTLSPVELAQLAGVDMTTPAPIRKAIAFVGTLVDDLEKSF
ncbi:MAG TPA: oligoendopeptidase F [Symbiobacteriaceae bacterium]|nr:oligoendopeptidase F [Symbiobacteriaceae bacterium]